jgi:sigma-E factor negative regulatory protein RseC
MTEFGTVIKLKGEFAQVRIGRNSACGSCGKCGMTENQKYVDFYTQNTLEAKVGDQVELEIHDTNTSQLALVGYILPLIPALILLFVALTFLNELWATLLFFVGYALGFIIVGLIDKAKKHKWMASPTMIQIIKQTQTKGGTDNE